MATKVEEVLEDKIFRRYGTLARLITDNGIIDRVRKKFLEAEEAHRKQNDKNPGIK
jgi:hypothetical protein